MPTLGFSNVSDDFTRIVLDWMAGVSKGTMKPRMVDGALVGALLTAPLVAVSYLGWKALGLPFPPFDVFDWVARALPGSIVTFGIDSLVNVIRLLHVSGTSAVAKTAEQTMAIAMVCIGGAAAGAVLFGLLRLSD